MDKLTLEHLAPYLPYQLKVLIKNKTVELSRTCATSIETRPSVHGFTDCSFDDLKLILRPLSDLTKEIEHNGKSFAPIEWFEIGDDESENWFSFDHGNINFINDLNSISTHQVYHDINFLPYAVVQKLIEWHFDVFGLIEKGLAIFTDTLGKEVKGE